LKASDTIKLSELRCENFWSAGIRNWPKSSWYNFHFRQEIFKMVGNLSQISSCKRLTWSCRCPR